MIMPLCKVRLIKSWLPKVRVEELEWPEQSINSGVNNSCIPGHVQPLELLWLNPKFTGKPSQKSGGCYTSKEGTALY